MASTFAPIPYTDPSLPGANIYSAVASGTVGNVIVTYTTDKEIYVTEVTENVNQQFITNVNNELTGDDYEIQFNIDDVSTGSPGLTYNPYVQLLTTSSLTATGTTNLGLVDNIKMYGGTSGALISTDGNGNLSWVNFPSGNGVTGGSNTQVQFNDDNSFGGSAGLTFDKITGNLVASGYVVGSKLQSTNSNGANGGALELAAPAPLFSSLHTGVTVDVLENKVRIFETGGNNRGVFVDLINTADNAGTNLLDVGTTGPGHVQLDSVTSPVTLAVDSYEYLRLTGVTNANSAVKLPDATTLTLGSSFTILNDATGQVPVRNGANNLILNQPASQSYKWTLVANTTAAGTWATDVVGSNTVTGTGNLVAQSNATITNSTLDGNTVVSGNLNLTGTANFSGSGNVTLGSIANVHIGGGTANTVLSTDGNGNLTWVTVTSNTGGTVTSVGVYSTSLTVTNSPITTNGVIRVELPGNITANNFSGNARGLSNVITGNLIGPSNVSFSSLQANTTVSLTSTSKETLSLTGEFTVANANVGLPNAMTLPVGASYTIINNSASSPFVRTANGVPVVALSSGVATKVILTSNSTLDGSWSSTIIGGKAYTGLGNIVFNAGPTIISPTFTGTINATGASNVALGPVANVHITGGSNGQVLRTDGAGNLTWTSAGSVSSVGVVSNTLVVANTPITTSGNISLELPGNITANFTGNGANLTNLTGANVVGYVANSTHSNVSDEANTVAGANVTGTVANATFATTASTANTVAGANVTGTVANATYAVTAGSTANSTYANTAGTVTTAAQPNITSTGTLTSLTVSGNITGANITGNHYGAATGLTAIPGANVTGTVANATHATVANTANSVAVANVSGIGNIATINLSGNGSQTLLGNGTWGNAGSVANANYANIAGVAYSVAGANVTGTVASATVSASANSVAVANVVGIGNIATINLNGSSSQILYGNGSWASAPATYGNSNVAAFLAAFGSNTIVTTGNITGGNFVGNGQALTGIAGANVTGTVANATFATTSGTANSVAGANVTGQVANALVAGTVYTAAQPNITSTGTLTGLTLSGNLTGTNITANSVRSNNIIQGNTTVTISNTTWFGASTFTNNPNQVLYTTPAANIASIDFHITATDGTVSRQVSKVLAVTQGVTTNYTEYGLMFVGSQLGDYVVQQSAGNINLTVSPTTANTVQYNIVLTTYNS